jgi:hypothetical protein
MQRNKRICFGSQTTAEEMNPEVRNKRRQYLYFCTSKTSKANELRIAMR